MTEMLHETRARRAGRKKSVEPAGTSGPARPRLSVITLVNDASMYVTMRRSLMRQQAGNDVQWIAVDADAGGLNAAAGLNEGLGQARGSWMICAHQDVVFPRGWWGAVSAGIETWRQRHGRVPAVVGLVGVRDNGAFRGAVDDPHGFCRWTPLPSDVCSVDEHVIIVRRDAALRFDPQTPGFHCYGTDIALEARRRGLDVIAVDAPVAHRSPGRVDDSFARSARWLLGKWGPTMQGVIPTCAAMLVDDGASLARRLMVRFNRRVSVYRRRAHGWLRPQDRLRVEETGDGAAAVEQRTA